MQTKANELVKIEYDSSFKLKFWLLLSVFYLMFFIRNVIGFEFPVLAYLAWVVVMALAFDFNEAKALLVTFIPFFPAFQYKYAVLICLFILVFKNFKRITLSKACIWGVLIMLWELIHVAVFDDSILEFVRGFAEFICFMLLISISSDKEYDISKLIRSLGISSTVAFIMLVIVTLQNKDSSLLSLLEEGFRFGISENTEDFFNFNYNANGLGYMCNLVICGVLINIHNKKAKIIDYVSMVVCIFVGALTISRAFLVCLVLTFILYLLLQNKPIKKKISTVLIIAFACIIAILILSLAAPAVIENYVERFSVEDVTGGRSYLYDFYNVFIFSSPLRVFFGIGIQDVTDKILQFEKIEIDVPHDGYQQLIVAWGMIGFAFMFLFLLFLFFDVKKKNKSIAWIAYLPLLMLLINNLAGQFITDGFKILSLILVYEILLMNSKGSLNGNG